MPQRTGYSGKTSTNRGGPTSRRGARITRNRLAVKTTKDTRCKAKGAC